MSFAEVRIRGGGRGNLGPWPVGAIPKKVLMGIGKQLVHRLAIGQRDVSGDDFGTIFAKSIGGRHMSRPLGLADVVKNGTAWSVKTVKHKAPRSLRTVRLISGRCSLDYAMGIRQHDLWESCSHCPSGARLSSIQRSAASPGNSIRDRWGSARHAAHTCTGLENLGDRAPAHTLPQERHRTLIHRFKGGTTPERTCARRMSTSIPGYCSMRGLRRGCSVAHMSAADRAFG